MFDSFKPPSPGSQGGKGRRKKEGYVSLKRTSAQIRLDSSQGGLGKAVEVLHANLLLNDFSPGSICVFTSERIPVKELVSITIEKPRRFFCRGRVVQVANVETDTHIVMATDRFRYRIGINFITDSEEEKKTISEYYQELQEDHLGKKSEAA